MYVWYLGGRGVPQRIRVLFSEEVRAWGSRHRHRDALTNQTFPVARAWGMSDPGRGECDSHLLPLGALPSGMQPKILASILAVMSPSRCASKFQRPASHSAAQASLFLLHAGPRSSTCTCTPLTFCLVTLRRKLHIGWDLCLSYSLLCPSSRTVPSPYQHSMNVC